MQVSQFCLDERMSQIKAKIIIFQALGVIATSYMNR